MSFLAWIHSVAGKLIVRVLHRRTNYFYGNNNSILAGKFWQCNYGREIITIFWAARRCVCVYAVCVRVARKKKKLKALNLFKQTVFKQSCETWLQIYSIKLWQSKFKHVPKCRHIQAMPPAADWRRLAPCVCTSLSSSLRLSLAPLEQSVCSSASRLAASGAWGAWPCPLQGCAHVSALGTAALSPPSLWDRGVFELPPLPSTRSIKMARQGKECALGTVPLQVLHFILSGELRGELVLKFCSLTQWRQRKYVC